MLFLSFLVEVIREEVPITYFLKKNGIRMLDFSTDVFAADIN